MKAALFTFLMLGAAAVNAQRVYTCPQHYPGNDKPASALTSAWMARGEYHGNGLYAGDYAEPAQEGYDLRYPFSPDEQAWLICGYGGTKRVKGRFHDGHEWNQRMEAETSEWWMKVAPGISACHVEVREVNSRDPRNRIWTVAATCR